MEPLRSHYQSKKRLTDFLPLLKREGKVERNKAGGAIIRTLEWMGEVGTVDKKYAGVFGGPGRS